MLAGSRVPHFNLEEAAVSLPHGPPGYEALSEGSLPAYLREIEPVAERLGGSPDDWSVREVGDGNLNLVFIVEGTRGACCVKQSLPYVRLVGEGWPMPLERAFFEYEVPSPPRHSCPRTAAGNLQLRSGPLLHRHGTALAAHHHAQRDDPRHPLSAVRRPHGGILCDEACLFTSDLYLPATEKKEAVAVFAANTELCKITEDLIFTDPYMVAETEPLDLAATGRDRRGVPRRMPRSSSRCRG